MTAAVSVNRPTLRSKLERHFLVADSHVHVGTCSSNHAFALSVVVGGGVVVVVTVAADLWHSCIQRACSCRMVTASVTATASSH